MNFQAVLALPKTASSAQTHKRIGFIELFGALYMYISEIESTAHWKTTNGMTYVLYAPSSDKTGYFRLIYGVIYHKGSAYLKEQNPFFRGLLTLTHAWLKVNTSSKSSLCIEEKIHC